jgi:uncharacterized protein (TIGR02466 family)
MYNYINLFPTVVQLTNIGREISDEEIECVRTIKESGVQQNIMNSYSADHKVFDHPKLHSLRDEAEKSIENYLNQIISADKGIGYEIILSWLNWTKPSEGHHIHRHPNSYLSGVLYIDSEEGDNITFHRDTANADMFWIRPVVMHEANSKAWKVPIKSGDIVIFPSNFEHSVEHRGGTKERISLAFNAIPRGSLGDPTDLTYIEI